MKYKKITGTFLGILILVSFCITGYIFYDRGRPAPVPVKQKLYEGITYRRVVRVFPRPLIAHVLTIDTRVKGIEFLITPPDLDGDKPLKARTTSQFLEEFGVQIAINGDKFLPWWANTPVDYYPHVGDPVAPIGFTASNGEIYWSGDETDGIPPTLYSNRRNSLTFNTRPGNVHNAISGERMIVLKGQVAAELDDEEVEPRTAMGLSKNGRLLYLVVVDGRQLFYSEGATFVDLAELLIDQGAYMAMSLDGGGSSTMVIEDDNGESKLLNSPIDSYIPGRERPVGNHFGVYVR